MKRALVTAFLLYVLPLTGSSAELLMFSSSYCEWCEVWKEEVGVIYAKTEEGKIAPLRELDIDDPLPSSLGLSGPIKYTPTFVLIDGERELGRITGYGYEDAFWGSLEILLREP